MHEPFTQKWNGAQAFPHPPQFLGSVSTSTQRPSHAFVSGQQTHFPAMQLEPDAQAFPHSPQWEGFVEVSVQSEPHSFSSLGHAQVPPAHT